jgi:hypothetical protein
MDGMSGLQPVGHFWPRVFRTILVYYGKPVDLSEFYDQPITRETAQAAIDKVFAEVGRLKRILQRYRRYRKHLLPKKPFWYRLYEP